MPLLRPLPLIVYTPPLFPIGDDITPEISYIHISAHLTMMCKEFRPLRFPVQLIRIYFVYQTIRSWKLGD